MKGYCTNCNKEVRLKEEKRFETYPVKGEEITVEATVFVCTDCEHDVWLPEIDDENLDKAYEIFRKKHGLLMPHEIQAIREKYGLSQTAFAKVLGFGEKTITRYENGSLQDDAPNNLLMLVKDPTCFMELFRHNKHKLCEGDIRKVEARRMTFTLPEKMKYYTALQKLGCGNYFFSQETAGDRFSIEKEEAAI